MGQIGGQGPLRWLPYGAIVLFTVDGFMAVPFFPFSPEARFCAAVLSSHWPENRPSLTFWSVPLRRFFCLTPLLLHKRGDLNQEKGEARSEGRGSDSQQESLRKSITREEQFGDDGKTRKVDRQAHKDHGCECDDTLHKAPSFIQRSGR